MHLSCRASLQKHLPIFYKKVVEFAGLFISAGLRLFLHLAYAALYSLQVFQLQLRINYLLIPNRVHTAIYVHNIRVVKAAEHMNDGICLPDVGQKLVAQTLTFAGPLHKACNIHNLYRGRNNSARVHNICKRLKPLVRNICGAYVRFYCAEGKIGGLRLTGTYTIKKCGLANIRQPNNSTF